MNFLKQSYPSLLVLLGEAVIGILMIVNPDGFIKITMLVLGIALIIAGAVALIRYFFLDSRGAAPISQLLLGALAAVLGVLCLIFQNGAAKTVAVIYALVLIANAIYKVYAFFATRKATGEASFFQLVSGAVALACGIVIIVNPFGVLETLWRFAGIALLAEAVIDAIAAVHVYKLLTD